MSVQVEKTKLDGVVLLTPQRFGDARGFFCESWNRKRMAEAGFDYDWVQDNHSMSLEVGTLRGLHQVISRTVEQAHGPTRAGEGLGGMATHPASGAENESCLCH